MSSSNWTTEKALADPVPEVCSIEPFPIEFSKSELDDLRSRLRNARYADAPLLPEDKENAQTKPSPAWIRTMIEDHWLNEKEFSLERMVQEMNKYPHFVADIDWCRRLHFVHKRSSRKDAIPLMLIHGWPGTFHEFWHVVGGLTEPERPEDPAFHVVIPSLPGFLFSQPPPTRTHMIGDIYGYCRVMNALMIHLGYGDSGSASSDSPWSGYAVQGGDWGSAHARVIANIPGSRVKAVHLNFCPARPSGLVGGTLFHVVQNTPIQIKDFLADYVLPASAAQALKKAQSFQASMAYYHVQHWRPSQLLNGLIDSPVGLLSWIGYFFSHRIPSPNVDPKATLNVSALLTNLSLFWLTKSIGTSFLPYTINEFLPEIVMESKNYIQQPFGFSEFPEEIVTTPAAWAGRTGNLRWSVKASRGGHFAALEVPDVFVAHLRAAFGRKGNAADRNKSKDAIKEQTTLKGGLWDEQYQRASKGRL